MIMMAQMFTTMCFLFLAKSTTTLGEDKNVVMHFQSEKDMATTVYNKLTSILCPDHVSHCPGGNTCCLMTSGEYRCCPMLDGVCCSDQTHCCPNGYDCNMAAGTCNKGKIAIPLSSTEPSLEVIAPTMLLKVERISLNSHQTFHHDGGKDTTDVSSPLQKLLPQYRWNLAFRHNCPDHSFCAIEGTCCPLSPETYGCCPMKMAFCCSEKDYCCPFGYDCATSSSVCTKSPEAVSLHHTKS